MARKTDGFNSKKQHNPRFLSAQSGHVLFEGEPIVADELDWLLYCLTECVPFKDTLFITDEIDRLENRVVEERVISRGETYNREKNHCGTWGGANPPPAPAGRRSRQDIHILLKDAHRPRIRKKGYSLRRCCITKRDMRAGKRDGVHRRPKSDRLATYRGETRHIITVADSFGCRTFYT